MNKIECLKEENTTVLCFCCAVQ